MGVKPGQRLTFDVIGRRLGSQLDPMVRLFDAKTGREMPGNYTLKAPLYSSGSVQSFAVQIYTTAPVILGWIKMHENKNGNSRGAP